MSTQTQVPSYKEGLHELREGLKSMLPEDALAIFDNDAKTLNETHQSILVLKEGDKAPEFSLSNATGQIVSLSELLTAGRVVLVFYRGTWCPYCNLQLQQYQKMLSEMKSFNANLVAISPQTPDESLNIQQKNELQFEVLSDNGNIVARQFTTVFKNGEVPVQTMQNLGIDFDSFYSDNSQELPVPAVFIIEQDRSISFAQSEGGDYRNRVEVSTIISKLKENYHG